MPLLSLMKRSFNIIKNVLRDRNRTITTKLTLIKIASLESWMINNNDLNRINNANSF